MYLCTWMHTTGCMWRSEGNLGCGSLPSTLLISLPCSCGCKVHCSVNFWGFSWFYLHLLAELSDYRCSHYVGYRSLNSGLHACLLSHLPSPIFYLNFKLYLLVKLCLAFKSCCNYILWITQLKKPQNCLYDGSVVEGTGHQARWPEFDLWGPYGQRREPTPISFSLASTYSPLHIHIQYAYIYHNKCKRPQNHIYCNWKNIWSLTLLRSPHPCLMSHFFLCNSNFVSQWLEVIRSIVWTILSLLNKHINFVSRHLLLKFFSVARSSHLSEGPYWWQTRESLP